MHIDTQKMTAAQKEKILVYLNAERPRLKDDAFQEAMDRQDAAAAVEALLALDTMRDPDTGTLVAPEEQRRSMDLDQVLARAMLIHVFNTIRTTF